MKLKLLFSIAILLSIWSISPDAWGLINRNHIFKELTDQTLPTPTKDTAVIVFVLHGADDPGLAIGDGAVGDACHLRCESGLVR